jgi:hypothetical protein
LSLRRDLTCPNCDGREIWRIERMHERGHGSVPQPFGVVLERTFWTGSEAKGHFEVLICRGCGFTEWYAKEIDFLKSDPVNGVHLIVNDVETKGPYR